MNGTLTTLHDKFFKEKTISRRIWGMTLLLFAIVAAQICLAVALPGLIFNRERAIIDSLQPVILTSTDVRRDVLSMIGGSAQWGLTGKGTDLALYRYGLASLPNDITTLKMVGASNRNHDLDDKIDALAAAAQDEFSTVQAIVSGADVSGQQINKQVAAGIVDERDKLTKFMSVEKDLSAAVERERQMREHQAATLMTVLVLFLVITSLTVAGIAFYV